MEKFLKLVDKSKDRINDLIDYIEHNQNVYEYLCETLNKEYLTEKDILNYIAEGYDGYLTEPKGE